MATTQTKILTGSGTASGATSLVTTAGTLTKTAATLVTLPSTPGYEYEVTISGYATGRVDAGGTTESEFWLIVGPSNIYRMTLGINATGTTQILVGYNGSRSSNVSTITKETIPAVNGWPDNEGKPLTTQCTFSAAPGQAIIVDFVQANIGTGTLSAVTAGVYYYQYSYIGRKTVTEAF